MDDNRAVPDCCGLPENGLSKRAASSKPRAVPGTPRIRMPLSPPSGASSPSTPRQLPHQARRRSRNVPLPRTLQTAINEAVDKRFGLPSRRRPPPEERASSLLPPRSRDEARCVCGPHRALPQGPLRRGPRGGGKGRGKFLPTPPYALGDVPHRPAPSPIGALTSANTTKRASRCVLGRHVGPVVSCPWSQLARAASSQTWGVEDSNTGDSPVSARPVAP